MQINKYKEKIVFYFQIFKHLNFKKIKFKEKKIQNFLQYYNLKYKLINLS